ncbi:MAG: phosphotransferase [Candidatus Roizmanbacteria bacterium]
MDKDLKEIIEQAYNLDNIEILEKLSTKGGREVYKINSDGQTYVVKISSSEKDAEQITKDTEILLFLNLHKVPTPKLLRTKDNKTFLENQGKYSYIYEFIEGTHPYPSLEFFHKLGTLLAKLHLQPVNDYPHQSSFTPEIELPRIKQELLKMSDSSQSEMINELVKEIDNFPNFNNLPKTIIHTDPYFFNLLEGVDNKLYLIDLDDAGIAPAIIDVGYVLAHMCTLAAKDRKANNVEDEDNNDGIIYRSNWADEFIRSYEQIRLLTDEEKRLLPFAAIFTMVVYIDDGEEDRVNLNNFNRYLRIKQELDRY